MHRSYPCPLKVDAIHVSSLPGVGFINAAAERGHQRVVIHQRRVLVDLVDCLPLSSFGPLTRRARVSLRPLNQQAPLLFICDSVGLSGDSVGLSGDAIGLSGDAIGLSGGTVELGQSACCVVCLTHCTDSQSA